MNGICGVVRFDGGPADTDALGRMLPRLGLRSPGEPWTWSSGPAALAAVGEDAFAVADEAALLLDGRVDDEDALRTALRQRGIEVSGEGDASLLLAARDAFGDGLPDRFVGDFALASWDGRERCLLLARDAVGIRPLFLRVESDRLLFASDPVAVLAGADRDAEPDEAVLGERLALRSVSYSETMLRGVRRLGPGERLVLRGGAVRIDDWWNPGESCARLPRLREGEDVEAVRAVLDECIAARLRGVDRCAVLLSGGLDSAVVAALAAGACGDVGALTGVFPGLPGDEGARAAATAAALGLSHRPVAWRPPALEAYAAQVRRHRLPPLTPHATFGLEIHRAATAEGRVVVLDGHGGDEWAGGHAERLADLLRSGRWLAARREVRAWSGGGTGVALRRYGIAPLLPHALLAWRRRRCGIPAVPAYLRDSFVERVGLRDRLAAAPASLASTGAEMRVALEGLRAGWWQEVYESLDRTASAAGVDLRHPLMDRRFIERLLSLPAARRGQGRRTKVVLREAAVGRVPDDVRLLEEKPHAGDVFAGAVRDLVEETPPWHGPLVERGIVDPERLQEEAGRLRDGTPATPGHHARAWRLFESFAVSLWLDMLQL